MKKYARTSSMLLHPLSKCWRKGEGKKFICVVEKVLNNYGVFVLCAGDFVPSRGVFVPS